VSADFSTGLQQNPQRLNRVEPALMQIEIVSYAGWKNNLRLFNDSVEVIVSLDIGPRVLSYRTLGGRNILKNYPEQMGQAGENAWMLRGGHRLWIAPEDEKITYHWDNEPVTHRIEPSGHVFIESIQTEPIHIRKDLALLLDASGSRLTVRHVATNLSDEPLNLATWGATVLEPGGVEIIPQPPLGEHPRDLLPNRTMILWPYTDLSDPRWRFGRDFILLRQSTTSSPTKLGLAHREKWVAYVLDEFLFIKTFDHHRGATYPDNGSNFETFSNSEMLEIESLGPLSDIAPGASAAHSEQWWLFDGVPLLPLDDEKALAAALHEYLHRAGIA
jgi:hypothetical protein